MLCCVVLCCVVLCCVVLWWKTTQLNSSWQDSMEPAPWHLVTTLPENMWTWSQDIFPSVVWYRTSSWHIFWLSLHRAITKLENGQHWTSFIQIKKLKTRSNVERNRRQIIPIVLKRIIQTLYKRLTLFIYACNIWKNWRLFKPCSNHDSQHSYLGCMVF